MTKLFLDTNVILDLLLPGREGMQAARSLLDLREACPEEIRIHLSFLSVENIAYILRKAFPREQTAIYIRNILKICQATGMSDMLLYDALNSRCPDFEDALQIACAEADCCDFIITSNIRHFREYSRIPVYTPAEFLQRIDR